ncbi:hypothetical protein, partial [Escherichia coli]
IVIIITKLVSYTLFFVINLRQKKPCSKRTAWDIKHKRVVAYRRDNTGIYRKIKQGGDNTV